jgi:predicted dehydrogenase
MGNDQNYNFSFGKLRRRELLKNLATIPVLGAFAYAVYRKRRFDRLLKESGLYGTMDMNIKVPEAVPVKSGGKLIRLGLIGNGIRGKQLAAAAGYLHPSTIDDYKKAAGENRQDRRYQDFLAQEDLNVVITGVCDIFDTYGEMAREAAANINRAGSDGHLGEMPKRYSKYKEMLAADDIDAVIIATPDHWHARMTIDAANAGKHVYCEKPLTRTVEEAIKVRETIKRNNIIFQLGHNNRQSTSYIMAKEIIEKNILGKVTLIETSTNRNDPNGAWVYPIHDNASPETVDWEQFIGDAPDHEFSLERFFRWRCWWDYSTGLSGDLLTHEYDAMKQIFGLGIPHSAISSGGIYFFKDGRTVPDVLHTVLEFPERELSFLYSATLASSKRRKRLIMGHDATMDLGNDFNIYIDGRSTRFREQIEQGIIKPDTPAYSYIPGREGVDVITSATEQYFADRGLLYTYRGGQRVDVTHLHMKEWIEAIRTGSQPSCDIDEGFEGAITAHMGTTSFHEKRQVFWDPDKLMIV